MQNFPFVCQSAVTDWVLRNRSQEQRSISASTSFGRWLLGTTKSLPVMEQSIMMNVSTSGQPGRGKEGAQCGQGSCPFQGASSVNPSHSQTLLSAGHPAPSPWGSWFPQSHFSGLYFWTWLHACRTTRSVHGSLWNWSGTFYANHNGSPLMKILKCSLFDSRVVSL